MNRYTTEYFIERARDIHKDQYCYDNVIYNGVYTKVEIICKSHGLFLQSPKKHLIGQGCKKCNVSKKNNLSFVEKANNKHNSFYNYSLIKSEPKSRDEIDIICPLHGIFSQVVKNHLAGSGCSSCGITKNSMKRLKTTSEFINDAKIIHGDLYDYSLVDYYSSFVNVDILCKEHGLYKQKPSDHLSGCGCPSCTKSGYKSNQRGFLYIQHINNEIYKVGITNFPETRIEQIKSKCYYTPKYIKLFSSPDGKLISDIERVILKEVKCGVIEKDKMKDGYTETFLLENLNIIETIINRYDIMEIYL